MSICHRRSRGPKSGSGGEAGKDQTVPEQAKKGVLISLAIKTVANP